jgi:hypothetical protein
MRRLVLLILCAAAVPIGAQTARQKAPPPKAPAAPKAAAPALKKELAVPFKVGETLEYDIGWSSYVTAGTATLTVKEKRASYGSTAYYIVAEGRPTPLLSKLYTLYYKGDTLLDVYSLLPQRGSLYSEEGKRHRMKTTLFNQTTKRASYEIETRTVVKKDLAIPGFTQDSLSAVYVLRSIPFKAGEKFNMPVTENGNVYQVQMQVGAVESIKTGIGTANAIKITPVITSSQKDAPRGITLWLSDDARRLPMKIEAQLMVGKFTIVLSKVTG